MNQKINLKLINYDGKRKFRCNQWIDCQILDGFAFTTVKYLYTDENVVILSELATDIRDWVNNGNEDATVEDVEKEWNIASGTFENFIENFQKINWKDVFIFI